MTTIRFNPKAQRKLELDAISRRVAATKPDTSLVWQFAAVFAAGFVFVWVLL